MKKAQVPVTSKSSGKVELLPGQSFQQAKAGHVPHSIPLPGWDFSFSGCLKDYFKSHLICLYVNILLPQVKLRENFGDADIVAANTCETFWFAMHPLHMNQKVWTWALQVPVEEWVIKKVEKECAERSAMIGPNAAGEILSKPLLLHATVAASEASYKRIMLFHARWILSVCELVFMLFRQQQSPSKWVTFEDWCNKRQHGGYCLQREKSRSLVFWTERSPVARLMEARPSKEWFTRMLEHFTKTAHWRCCSLFLKILKSVCRLSCPWHSQLTINLERAWTMRGFLEDLPVVHALQKFRIDRVSFTWLGTPHPPTT